MRRLLLLLVAFELAGCAVVPKMEKVESPQQNIGARLEVTLDQTWNHFQSAQIAPARVWTTEGLPIDELRVYAGVKGGEAIDAGAPVVAGAKKIEFRAGMQPDEIVAMFEGLYTKGGSTFKLDKLEPWSFGGEKGFRFEFTFTRKVDGVVNLGVGYGTVSKEELFALLYFAPRLGFFPRNKDKVEQVARSARLKM
jgi:hypothetical protein